MCRVEPLPEHHSGPTPDPRLTRDATSRGCDPLATPNRGRRRSGQRWW